MRVFPPAAWPSLLHTPFGQDTLLCPGGCQASCMRACPCFCLTLKPVWYVLFCPTPPRLRPVRGPCYRHGGSWVTSNQDKFMFSESGNPALVWQVFFFFFLVRYKHGWRAARTLQPGFISFGGGSCRGWCDAYHDNVGGKKKKGKKMLIVFSFRSSCNWNMWRKKNKKTTRTERRKRSKPPPPPPKTNWTPAAWTCGWSSGGSTCVFTWALWVGPQVL